MFTNNWLKKRAHSINQFFFSCAHFPALGNIKLHVVPALATGSSSCTISRARHRLHAFTSTSDWLTALSAFVVIGQMSVSIT